MSGLFVLSWHNKSMSQKDAIDWIIKSGIEGTKEWREAEALRMKREAEQKKLEKWQSKSSGRQLVEIILGLILLGFGLFVLYLCVLGGWKQPHH